jgi:hypothetical protein
MGTAELHWLAGLLEGEGCFARNAKQSPRAGGKPFAYIQLQMTDRDIVERVASIWKRNVNVSQPRGNQTKAVYRVVLRGKAVIPVLSDLQPLMGERRKARITELLGEFDG